MTVASSIANESNTSFAWEVGVDTGGTFTDCIARSRDGETVRAKVLSTSAVRGRLLSIRSLILTLEIHLPLADQTIDAFFRGFAVRLAGAANTSDSSNATIQECKVVSVRRMTSRTVELTLDRMESVFQNSNSDVKEIFVDLIAPFEAPLLAVRLAIGRPHPIPLTDCRICIGTTRGTNALLEGKVTPVTLFVNEGLEDILRIGDQRRLDIFARAPRKMRAIERNSVGVPARISHDGNEIRPLDEQLMRSRARETFQQGSRSAAIALLHSDPTRAAGVAHEIRVAEILREEGFSWISFSHQCGSTSRFEARARAAVVDAALSGPVGEFIQSIAHSASGAEILMMTSAGGLIPAAAFQPRESLLSGPAGGVAGAAAIAAACGFHRCVTLDMGGTSADVARVDGAPEMRDETTVGPVSIASPCVAVESVAAGGGSILWWDGEAMRVGPRSAGASPGPACYGTGGPLTLTDANLLLGRIDRTQFAIPVSLDAAQGQANALHAQIAGNSQRKMSIQEMLESFIAIADEAMASAIRAVTVRRGVDPADHALVAFGGAGGLHACAVAERLGIRTVVYPLDAGLLCASGISCATITRIVTSLVLCALSDCDPSMWDRLEQLQNRGETEMGLLGIDRASTLVTRKIALMRLTGTEESIEVEIASHCKRDTLVESLTAGFRLRFREIYGFDYDHTRKIEVERIRIHIESARIKTPITIQAIIENTQPSNGPMTVMRRDSTAFIAAGWQSHTHKNGAMIFNRIDHVTTSAVSTHELLAAQLGSIATDMGEQLRRTAVSANIKDRLDFSCGLLDAEGFLVINAPHIPIHLGALGSCIRSVKAVHEFKPGQVVVVNHPRFGGSHLPDLTVITPIFTPSSELIGFAANRAHHAEIGGSRPGSMPPDATTLEQEGIVIEPTVIVEDGAARFDRIEDQLRSGKWPSRLVDDNLADLRAQVAANELAAIRMRGLVGECTIASLRACCDRLRDSARRAAERAIEQLPIEIPTSQERLDDGTILSVRMKRSSNPTRLEIDFTSTASTHPRNLNAPFAVTRAAVMYSIRVLVGQLLGAEGPAFPLNEGLLDPVQITLPNGSILSPDFSGSPEACPACAIGQTETSQRLVDLLWRCFDLAACSQGTINNLLFGNARFGFYETIAGGAGATCEGAGESGVHTHISNTRITDAEVLERRYPVRLETFRMRTNSGGAGKHRGGDGLVRRIRFLESVDLSFLSQHRVESPYGLAGGGPGMCGAQRIIRADGRIENVAGIVAARMEIDDQFEIETPGGGGFGAMLSTL